MGLHPQASAGGPTVLVKITQRHIDQGVACSSIECMLALGLNEATGEAWSVGPDECGRRNGRGESIPLPLRAIVGLTAFDRREKVAPFEFELKVP